MTREDLDRLGQWALSMALRGEHAEATELALQLVETARGWLHSFSEPALAKLIRDDLASPNAGEPVPAGTARKLLAMVLERDRIMADLIQDRDGHIHAEAERGRIIALIEEEAAAWTAFRENRHGENWTAAAARDAGAKVDTLRWLAKKLRDAGPCRPPLPPDVVRAENERLQQALREIIAVRLPVGRDPPAHEVVGLTKDIAHKALGEEG